MHTFGHQRVLPRAGHGAVDLSDQLHVVQKGVEGVKVGEADHVGGAASCSLAKDKKDRTSDPHKLNCCTQKLLWFLSSS